LLLRANFAQIFAQRKICFICGGLKNALLTDKRQPLIGRIDRTFSGIE
jgi:hypothetical protein